METNGYRNAQKALAVMTAWADGLGKGPTDFAGLIAVEAASDGPDGLNELIAGFISLSGLQLQLRLQDTGQPYNSTLQDLGRHLAEHTEQ